MKISIPTELGQVGSFVRGVERSGDGYFFFLDSVRESDGFESVFDKKNLDAEATHLKILME